MGAEVDADESFCSGMRRRLWNLLENPNSSIGAKVVAVISCLFVVGSTLSLIISTLPHFQVNENATKTLTFPIQNRNSDGVDTEHKAFAVAEAVFVGWFTFEYLVRFVAAPQKWT